MALARKPARKGITGPQPAIPCWAGDAPAEDVDWQILSWRVNALLTKAELHGGGPLKVLQPGSYWSEPVQDAIVRTFRVWSKGGAGPVTREKLAYVVSRRAKHIDDKRRSRLREERRAFGGSDEEIAMVLYGSRSADLFDEICARDLFAVFITELTNGLDEQARALLAVVLIDGVPVGDTMALAKALGTEDLAAVQNMKRRIKYKAGPLLRRLSGDDENGGGNG